MTWLTCTVVVRYVIILHAIAKDRHSSVVIRRGHLDYDRSRSAHGHVNHGGSVWSICTNRHLNTLVSAALVMRCLQLPFDFHSTAVQRAIDCLSKVTKFAVT